MVGSQALLFGLAGLAVRGEPVIYLRKTKERATAKIRNHQIEVAVSGSQGKPGDSVS